MLERRNAEESTMDTQGSSVAEPLADVCVDMSSEGMAIEKAFQDGRKPTSVEDYQGIMNQSKTKEVLIEASSEGPIIDEASRDRGRPTLFEVYMTITNQSKASQDSGGPLEVMPMPVVNKKYEDLFVAAQKGDWKTIEDILKKDPEAMTAEVLKVEDESVTVLNIAIMASQDQLVENLIKRFHLGYKNFDFSISLQNAAMRGRIKMVKALVNKVDAELESVPDALWIATQYAPKQKDVIWYLAKRKKSAPIYGTMSNLVMAGHLAPKWFKISLWDLATKPGAALLINRIELRHKCSLEFAELVLTKMKNDMKKMETPEIPELLPRIVLEAASRGISEIVKLCFEYFPELTWNENFTKKLIEEVVNGRHVELFRLVNSASTIPFLTADTMTKRNLMKAVVEWPPRCLPTDVSGAPFLMQRELQWFKVLEDTSDSSSKSSKLKKLLQDTIHPSLKGQRLPDDQKPYWDDFVEKHKQLLKEAGQWMKDTSSSCSLVSTLIITVAFAAIFTIPGGNKGETEGSSPSPSPSPSPSQSPSSCPSSTLVGIPNFLCKHSFMVFAVADALALFSSVTATLMFLAILTSRYAAEDFLISLPRKMILGLTFLFLSLAFMLVAFGSAFTIVLSERFVESDRLIGIYIPITLFAAIPVVLFAILQLPLYFEMVGSTYWPLLYRPLKLWE
ncbi:ankyrin repeat-containing protein ITN1-like isoform X2 [Syzygium oleosum]|uniref:ankyrin repeat-containing protein ITN1-like isoform X2 n=1 Tax=Syzygium oleosum TaxID=219896 RepID=UPI0024BB506E|nr:ankyrin repeat-containing protein ITN1-like isoform X2 [Syzygium oleosum]